MKSTEFLEKIILVEEKVASATSFAKNWLWSHLNLKNCKKYEGKQHFLGVENPLQEYKKSIFDHCKWYIAHMAELILIKNLIPQQARDVFKTFFRSFFKVLRSKDVNQTPLRCLTSKRRHSKVTDAAKRCSSLPVCLEKKQVVNQTPFRRLSKRRHYPGWKRTSNIRHS